MTVRELIVLLQTMPQDAPVIYRRCSDYDVLWYCLGGTTVRWRDQEAIDRSSRINVAVPLVIASAAPPDRRLVFFSTDGCADESAPHRPERRNPAPVGVFAQIKLAAEERLLATGRPLTSIVRVGPLYGTQKPADTFPGRVLEAFGFNRDCSIALPANLVTPTPSFWVAAVVLDHLARDLSGRLSPIEILHCSPRGNVSIRDWAILTLQGLREYQAFAPSSFFDPERPAFSALGCSVAAVPHWYALWRVYFRQAWFTPTELRHLLPDETTPLQADGGSPAS